MTSPIKRKINNQLVKCIMITKAKVPVGKAEQGIHTYGNFFSFSRDNLKNW